MRSSPPEASGTPATTILKRLDAKTMNPNQVCVFSTFVSEADTIHPSEIKNSKKATSATLPPVLCEKERRRSLGDPSSEMASRH
jgi:hypothetical protein